VPSTSISHRIASGAFSAVSQHSPRVPNSLSRQAESGGNASVPPAGTAIATMAAECGSLAAPYLNILARDHDR